ncbi:MAG: cupin domain-containing protein [Actinobacteria bacterium]|nr:cupin domain-containing protein [Actinomycetota bacterium]
MRVFNLHGNDWDRAEEREGWRSKDAFVGSRIGAELIGGSLYELEPGGRLWPYHAHHANEEWLLVVRGTPTLRSPEGEQDLTEGDVVCFPRGKAGAHQVSNGTDSPIRVLMLSTLIKPDIVEYLDSGKVGANNISGERILLGRPGPILDYWDGEE